MKIVRQSILLFSAISILSNCSGSQTGKNEQKTEMVYEIKKESVKEIDHIAAGHCRIVGSIISVSDQNSPGESDYPCSEAPCNALVKIHQIVGYGAGFSGDFSENDSIPVHFSFTLSETKSLNLKLDQHLPGLKKGDRFKADLESRPVFGGGQQYEVSLYEVVENK